MIILDKNAESLRPHVLTKLFSKVLRYDYDVKFWPKDSVYFKYDRIVYVSGFENLTIRKLDYGAPCSFLYENKLKTGLDCYGEYHKEFKPVSPKVIVIALSNVMKCVPEYSARVASTLVACMEGKIPNSSLRNYRVERTAALVAALNEPRLTLDTSRQSR